jgi:muramidase (phage lysozyme)
MTAITAVEAGSQELVSFLSLIGWSEGTTTSIITKDDGYDVIVGGVKGQTTFSDYTRHPFEDGQPAIVVRHVPLLQSTAAGRYQILLHDYLAYKAMLKLPDFSPLSQDKMALQLLKEVHVPECLRLGNIQGAITAASSRWASFPGNNYGQGGKSMEALIEKFTLFNRKESV